ncbi:hypothetical protein KIL84_022876 [Mauremys mutica]|uniref:Uncharacterized protein n=1 Tax=Mauremys mutica TaxID=74926 RepID=A0A9D3WQJ2_9SAUR|nr:hypothetical protein KIL84_022876 [Mauremys mutica]
MPAGWVSEACQGRCLPQSLRWHSKYQRHPSPSEADRWSDQLSKGPDRPSHMLSSSFRTTGRGSTMLPGRRGKPPHAWASLGRGVGHSGTSRTYRPKPFYLQGLGPSQEPGWPMTTGPP